MRGVPYKFTRGPRELPGVGRNMHDHYTARVSYPVSAQTANERSWPLPLAGEVMRWLFTVKGMLT